MQRRTTNRNRATRSRILTLFMAFAAAALACGRLDETAQPTAAVTTALGSTTAAPTGTDNVFRDNAYQIMLPDWPASEPPDADTLIALQSAGQAIAVARHAALPRVAARQIARVLPDYGDFRDIAVRERSPWHVTVEAQLAGPSPQQARFDLQYCAGFSYQVRGSAPAATFADFEVLYEQALSEAACADNPQRAEAANGLIGMVVTPSHDNYEFANFRAALVEARAAGAQAAHTYLSWADVETDAGTYDWDIADHLIDAHTVEGFRLSLVVEYIHTGVPGRMPPDLVGKSFDDPQFVDRAAAFAAAVAARYGDQLDYLALGNEVNIYFAEHPDELHPYLTAFAAMRAAVHAVRPELPVGTTLAFHSAVSSDRFDLIDAFKVGDFLAYTYYPHSDGFRYDGDPSGFGAVLDKMAAASGATPFTITENGWATAPSLGGSEARQAAYVRATFEALSTRRGTFGHHTWFSMHDAAPDSCETSARSFLPEDFDPAPLGDVWGAFQDYLCTLGLRSSDGAPKQGWQAFTESAAAYLETR